MSVIPRRSRITFFTILAVIDGDRCVFGEGDGVADRFAAFGDRGNGLYIVVLLYSFHERSERRDVRVHLFAQLFELGDTSFERIDAVPQSAVVIFVAAREQ